MGEKVEVNTKGMVRMVCGLLLIMVLIVYMSYSDVSMKKNLDKKVFGSTYMTMNNPYFEVLNNEIRKEVEANGDTLITLDPALDIDKQNEQIYRLIDQRVDIIFINAIDWQKVEPALQAAKEANIPIIVVDAPVYNKDLVTCTIVSDNYDAGVQCANDMMSKMESANIVLLEHSGAKSAKDRIDGFLDTIENNPQYQIVARAECEGQLEIAMPKMEEILETTQGIDVVMALNDPSALGALGAIESKQYPTEILVYGVDGSPEVKSLLQSDTIIEATAAQSPMQMGQIAIEKGYAILNGEVVESEIIVPVTLIKRENLEMFNIMGWQ